MSHLLFQIHRQFPVSFEFNDFFLHMMAYHYCSMRFHTFSLNSEKERTERGWHDYHVSWTHLKGGQADDFNSFWMFIDKLHKETMMFYNFNYSSHLSKVRILYYKEIDVYHRYMVLIYIVGPGIHLNGYTSSAYIPYILY